MGKDNAALSLSKLQKALGQDHVYVSASDSQRHFDSQVVIGAFLIHLFASAVRIAATEFAKEAGKAAWPTLVSFFNKLKGSLLTDHNSQVASIESSDNVLRSASKDLSGLEIEKFVSLTKDQLKADLISRRFPERNAQRIANEMATLLNESMSRDSRRIHPD